MRTWGRGLQPVSAGPGGALSLPVSWLPQGNSITSPKRMNVTHAPSCVKNGHFRVLHPPGVPFRMHEEAPRNSTEEERNGFEMDEEEETHAIRRHTLRRCPGAALPGGGLRRIPFHYLGHDGHWFLPHEGQLTPPEEILGRMARSRCCWRLLPLQRPHPPAIHWHSDSSLS